jgi:hypothetical protein
VNPETCPRRKSFRINQSADSPDQQSISSIDVWKNSVA